MSVNPVPEGHHTITPYILVEDPAKFLDFVVDAFSAEVTERVELPDGSVMHGQFKIGDSMVMTGAARDEWPALPTFLHLYVPDADALYTQAMKAGAESLQDPKDEFYGDRTSGVKDPFGNLWWIATHQEDVSPEEIERRAAQARGQG